MTIIPFIKKIREIFIEIESNLADSIATIIPWITPLPSAVLVSSAVVEKLHWSQTMGSITAIIIEGLGITTVSTSLILRDYNSTKRKSDPRAPFGLAITMVAAYLFSTISLTILLDIYPMMERYAPALFPILSLVGIINLVLRSEHTRRKTSIAQKREERKAERKSNAANSVKKKNSLTSTTEPVYMESYNSLHLARTSRLQKMDMRIARLLTLYKEYPKIGATEAGRLLGISRQSVYAYLKHLENDGCILKGKDGYEVIDSVK